ncbi:uncharacterized mitochondrial protein AtMg00310-like [Vicia villosa]|uniref:uncharacterized mitochondrial protein AtMg00310-like n=1 Tax=Vicia villosa TaxID=3911 RepID=UPI00273C7B6D|nr:uncharacterized mitochondrial protein AtMg00310-like [Vicia villosa]
MPPWIGRMLSIGGRVTLINSVLSNVPVYYLSFFKIPALVVEEIIRIQRKFLWNHNEEKKGMNWVSWSSMCKHQNEGGLGIKDLAKFNKALLAKWVWRFLNEEKSIWKGVLESRYGVLVERSIQKTRVGRRSMESVWWKDLMKLSDFDEANSLSKFLSFKLVDGKMLPFWYARWLGQRPLSEVFPTLYMAVPSREVCVNSMGCWDEELWNWQVDVNTEVLNVEILNEKRELMEILSEVRPRMGVKDSVVWSLGGIGEYFVKSYYSALVDEDDTTRED